MMRRRNSLKTARLLKQAAKHCWRAGRILFVSLAFSSLCKGICELAEIYLLQNLFARVENCLQRETDLGEVIRAAVILGITLILSQGIQLWEYLSQGYFWRRGNGYFHSMLHRRLAKQSALSYENPKFLDQWEKAAAGCEDAPDAVECIFHILCYYIPFFTLTTWYLYRLAPALVAAMAVILISALVSQRIKAARTYTFEKQVSGLQRKWEHYENCIAGRDYVKETRFLGAVGFFMKRYDDTMRKYHDQFCRKERHNLKIDLILSGIDVLGYLMIFCLMLYYIRRGSLHVVEFAAVYFAVERVKNAMEDMVSTIGEAMQSVVRMSFLFEFLSEERNGRKPESFSKDGSISLKHVSFSYPFGKKKVLKDISLKISPGETVAIVGDNGAGKSTLTKILIGLYPPQEGIVLYDGRSTEAERNGNCGVMEDISGVFQNFNRYFLTLKENVTIGDFSAKHDSVKLLEQAGFFCNDLPEKENTLLGKEFGGTELSGGEWQRVAVARGLYKNGSIIALDEPTAAIDPLEESRLFELFRKVSAGKTCILVTHRMGAVKMADKIFMLDQGRIAEEGTHEELMALGGKYSEMYRLQAKWY